MPFGFLPRSRTSAAPTPATAAADDDAALLSRCADGDAEALARVYRRHGDAVYRYAWLVTGSESLAADVVQETFVALLDRPSGFDPARGRAAAYLCGIARHLAVRQFDPRMESTASIEALAEQALDNGVPLPPPGGAEPRRLRACMPRSASSRRRSATCWCWPICRSCRTRRWRRSPASNWAPCARAWRGRVPVCGNFWPTSVQ